MSKKNVAALEAALVERFAGNRPLSELALQIQEKFGFLGEEICKNALSFYQERFGKEFKELEFLALKGALRQNFPEEFARQERKEELRAKSASFKNANKAYERGELVASEIKTVEELSSFDEAETIYFYGVISADEDGLKLGDWHDDSYIGELIVAVMPDGKEVAEFLPHA